MKTLGLIGGMSWESTILYYKLINEGVKHRLGGLHSAKLLLWSFDFEEITTYQKAGEWDKAEARMVEAGLALKQAGAEGLAICTNTMHLLAPAIEKATGLPLLHIADATASAIKEKSLKKIGLLATKFTMEREFYKERLQMHHGLDILIPEQCHRDQVHDIIFGELCCGIIKEQSKKCYLECIEALIAEGAEGIILGCTEIGLLIKQEDVRIPVFDTTPLHAAAAVEFILG